MKDLLGTHPKERQDCFSLLKWVENAEKSSLFRDLLNPSAVAPFANRQSRSTCRR
jgi:hypothetical protein